MENHEKLQLSKQDLRFLYTQLLNSTMEKLDLHLPTSGNDPLKNKVANMLHDHVVEVFEMAKHSMVVDGEDMTRSGKKVTDLLSIKLKERIEPFDFALNSQLRAILQNIEKETVELTQLRRQMPHDAKKFYDVLVQTTDNEVSTVLEALENPSEPDDEPSEPEAVIPSFEALAKDYEAHLIRLDELRTAIPQQKAELDRLDEITQFLETKYNEDLTHNY